MITLRKAQDRGVANFGWLDSKHSFSFGAYYDSAHMGFSALRVLNDDSVAPGAGFGTHGHKDMEIISFVIQGALEHKDSMGNVQSLPKGEFQLMSAGRGVLHSEYNGSKTQALRFLQIWIQPNAFGGDPGYQQKDFGNHAGLTPIITPNGDNGTLSIKQDATISQLVLHLGESMEVTLDANRKYYVHQVEGSNTLNKHLLTCGDGAKIELESSLVIHNPSESDTSMALLFDLPA
ncbi:pirin family protein [Aliiglaciecola litoralis]|uniref:Pirin family protein n=1 Tax=Aliiglaciecola litoralis TaxID=582857 RepID=A0ABP3WPC4_9ALTE